MLCFFLFFLFNSGCVYVQTDIRKSNSGYVLQKSNGNMSELSRNIIWAASLRECFLLLCPWSRAVSQQGHDSYPSAPGSCSTPVPTKEEWDPKARPKISDTEEQVQCCYNIWIKNTIFKGRILTQIYPVTKLRMSESRVFVFYQNTISS